MAVDIYSLSEPSFISPRISFSHDLNNPPPQTTTTTSDTVTTTTFDFCIPLNLNSPLTSADELFFDGVLLPTHIKNPKEFEPVTENEAVDHVIHVHRKRLKELLSDHEEEQEGKSLTRSFWKFTRTTSLNTASGPKRLIRSLSLKRLLRSDSTLNLKRNESNELNDSNEDVMKVVKKSNSRKDVSSSLDCRLSYSCNGSDSRRRSVGKKDSGGGNEVTNVLNVPAGFNMNLFGYGSLFCKSKPKSKSK